MIGLIILLGVIVDTYRRRFSEVRRAVQVLRSTPMERPVDAEHGATALAVEDVAARKSAAQSNFSSGLRDDRSEDEGKQRKQEVL